jgi:PST family polysaccharide transporter
VPRLRIWAGRIFVVSLAPITTYGSRFAGNIILSRLLAPDEFGTAIAISTVLGLGGLISDVALDRFVIINGSKQALATAHMLSVAIAALLAAALIVFAPAVAGLFGVADFADSFALAAGVSAFGGLAHLGIKQIRRTYDYGPDSAAQVVANLSATAALFVAATTLRNHRAIIASFAVQSIVYVILSHFLARIPYKLSCNKPMLRQALSFGLPLTFNGLGLAVMYQLDRVLVGYWFGVKELAAYAVIFSMSVVPTNMLLGVFSGPSLSYLLSGKPDSSDQSDRYRLVLGFYSILGSLYAFWLVLGLDILTPTIFGASFTISPLAHVLFTLIACLRLLRGGAPTTLLLASGRTRQLALLNLSSGIGLMIAFVCIVIRPRFESMLLGIAIGEAISFTFFLTLCEEATKRGSKAMIDLATTIAAPILLAAGLAWSPDITWHARGSLFFMGLMVVIAQLSFELFKNRELRDLFSR